MFIEESDEPLPNALTCAKQCILNKKGPAAALNKRIIIVLPALLLAYTGSRYRQLQSWLLASLPPAILGGVQDRHMASLYNEVRLELDLAQGDSSPVVGVKLDKSKALDRIVPAYAAVLMLAFGLPKQLVNVFVKLYRSLHCHMAYRNWVRPIATTAANGVAQGCSLSLLAMNMYNKVWYHLLEHLPGISARAFVDDSYLWCKLNHIHDLRAAIQITQLWDQLVGQLFNPNKSSMWSSHTDKSHLVDGVAPNMAPHQFVVQKHYIVCERCGQRLLKNSSKEKLTELSMAECWNDPWPLPAQWTGHKSHKLWRKGSKVHCTECMAYGHNKAGCITPSKQLLKACGKQMQGTLPQCFRPKGVTD